MIQRIKKIMERDIVIFALLFFVGIGIYANTIKAPFIWDDLTLIQNNEQIKSFSTEHFKDWFTTSSTSDTNVATSNLYRPMQKIINASVYHFFKLEPFAYRILNILLHIANTFFVFLLLKKLGIKRIGAVLSSLVFLVHPIQVEAVTYISGLPDALAPFFILSGLLFFKSNKNIFALIALVFAFLSKEIAVIFLPLAALITIYDWKTYDKKTRNSKLKWLATFAILSIIYVILKLTLLNFTGSVNLTTLVSKYTQSRLVRTITFISVLWEYFHLIIFPYHLFFEKIYLPVNTLLTLKGIFGISVLIGGGVLAYKSYFKSKQFFFAFFWFFIALAPVSGILIISNALYAERWLYVPIIGIVFGIATLWERLKTKNARLVYICILIVFTLIFSSRTILRNHDWAESERFYTNEIENNSYSPRLFSQLGTIHFEKGNYHRAIKAFSRSVELDDIESSAVFRFNLGQSYYYVGRNDEAMYWLGEALRIEPDYKKAQDVLNKIIEENKIY